jgi:hypothetical protein
MTDSEAIALATALDVRGHRLPKPAPPRPHQATTRDHLQKTARVAFDPKKAYLVCDENGKIRIAFGRVLLENPHLPLLTGEKR